MRTQRDKTGFDRAFNALAGLAVLVMAFALMVWLVAAFLLLGSTIETVGDGNDKAAHSLGQRAARPALQRPPKRAPYSIAMPDRR